MILVDSVGSITTLEFPSVGPNVLIVDEYYHFVHGADIILLAYFRVMKPTHINE